MKGIYRFYNPITNKSYIGQSVNLKNRYRQHQRCYTNQNLSTYNSIFYRALRKYGFETFEYEILHCANSCEKERLNRLEMYYIAKYNAFSDGYNMNIGGAFTSSEKKLKESQVLKIKRLIVETDIPLTEIAQQFQVSPSLISMINKGDIWNMVGSYEYPLRDVDKSSRGELNNNAKISEQMALRLREEFVSSTLDEMVERHSPLLSYSGLKKLLYGQTFKHLPIYKKYKKQWFLNGTCIDYSRLEK